MTTKQKKIEFIIEETVINSSIEKPTEIRYFTEINGRYVSNSVTEDKEEGYAFYKKICSLNGNLISKKTIESITI